jgi:hypothetical protein
VALVFAPQTFPLVTVELSTTKAMVATQRGRFVIAEGAVEARHRDTVLSFLTGVRVGSRHSLELKGGVSFLFGTPQREEFEFDDPGGVIGLTGGIDLVLALSDHISLVPTARYTFAKRGSDGLYFGLGSHLVRAGLSVAFDLAR